MYRPSVRKALFQFDPECAHELIFQQLRHITGVPFEALVRQKMPAKPVNCMDLTFKSPPGLAAGLDKDGERIDAPGVMGFGFIEIGTVTPRSQLGNDKPRLFHLVDTKGLISRMGFNSPGIDNPVENVKGAHCDGVLGINIGKNRDTPVEQGKDDYPTCVEEIYTYMGYIVINISPSNTPGLHTPQCGETLDDLLTTTKNKQNSLQVIHHKYMPIAVKIASDLSEEELIQAADSLIHHDTDGVIATNTTLNCSLIQGTKNCDRTGGLSGRPFQLKSTEITHRLSQELDGHLLIISVGGIDLTTAARGKIAAGVSLVQIYSGFIFRGPPLVKEVVIHI